MTRAGFVEKKRDEANERRREGECSKRGDGQMGVFHGCSFFRFDQQTAL
jgi:hypothetical protein